MDPKAHAKDAGCNGYPIMQRFDLVAAYGCRPACLDPSRRDTGAETSASGDGLFTNDGRIDVTDEALLLGRPR